MKLSGDAEASTSTRIRNVPNFTTHGNCGRLLQSKAKKLLWFCFFFLKIKWTIKEPVKAITANLIGFLSTAKKQIEEMS